METVRPHFYGATMEKTNRLLEAIWKETNHQYRAAEQAGRENKKIAQAIHKELARALERINNRVAK